MSFDRITVLGDGAMATVCAMLLASKGKRVTMWGPFAEHVHQMVQTRTNERYLPGSHLPESLHLTADDDEAVHRTELIVSAIPTQYIRSVWQRIRPHTPPSVGIVSVAKGIETETMLRPTQILTDVLTDNPDGPPRPLAALSGPSIARELSRCLPATVCIAGDDESFILALQELFTTQWFRVYTNPDLLGVELAGATKNVIAIAAGILDGLAAGYNAKSALLSRGLAEIARLGAAMGARSDTFFGIAGVGDLATTCFCPEGRNRTAGEMLGKGMKLDTVLERIQGVVEGVPTTRAVMKLAEKFRVEMPITAAVNDVLFEGLDPIDGIARLMSREPKQERVR
ncbi:MAG: NAD(P)H-dependent glycerol-3-phosphate dehydrogenase [Planctomycetes bacterium]|nr:NAD(P)H-dependent glycerol-3-phosphate dehydrogenase [Planctomycetota bacterium]